MYHQYSVAHSLLNVASTELVLGIHVGRCVNLSSSQLHVPQPVSSNKYNFIKYRVYSTRGLKELWALSAGIRLTS